VTHTAFERHKPFYEYLLPYYQYGQDEVLRGMEGPEANFKGNNRCQMGKSIT
jgi:hypothetical protein